MGPFVCSIEFRRRRVRGAGGRGERRNVHRCRRKSAHYYYLPSRRHRCTFYYHPCSLSATRAGGDVRSKQPKHDPGTKRMSGKKLSLRLIFRTLLPILPSICVSEVPLDARRAGCCSRSHLNGSEMAAFGSSRECRSEVGSNRTALL